jgi:hypothetical protein
MRESCVEIDNRNDPTQGAEGDEQPCLAVLSRGPQGREGFTRHTIPHPPINSPRMYISNPS